MSGFYPETELGQGTVDALKPMQDWQSVLQAQQWRYHTMADTQRLMANTKLELEQAKQAGALAGYTGSQTTGQNISNARSGMFLGAQKNALGGIQTGAQGQQPEAMPTPWGGSAPPTASSYGGETGREMVTPGGNARPGSLAPTYGPAGTVQMQYAPDNGPQSSNAPPGPGANALAAASPQGGAPGPSANSLAAASAVQHAEPAAQPIDQSGNALVPQGASGGQPQQVAQNALAPAGASPATSPAAFPSGEPPAGAPTHPSLMPPAVQKNPNYMPPGGSINPYVGLPVPNQWSAMATLGANDLGGWYKNLEGLAGRRATVMLQTIAGATDKPSWNAAVQNLYEQHFLTIGQAWQYYGHPELKQQVVNSLAPAASQVGYAGTALGQGFEIGPDGHPVPNAGMLNAKGPIQTETYVRNPDGSLSKVPVSIPRAGYVQSTSGGASPAATAAGAPGVPMPPATTPASAAVAPGGGAAQPMTWAQYSGALAGRESSGNPAVGQNPRSSASGLYQFTNDGWLGAVRQVRPDLAGMSDAGLLALRSNPEVQNQVLPIYTASNIAAMKAAGLPVNAATVALAHAVGPAGEQAVLNAPAAAPLSQVLSPETMKANPQFARMRVGDLINSIKSRFPLTPLAMPGEGQTGGSLLGVPGTAAPGPGGGPGAVPPVAPPMGAGAAGAPAAAAPPAGVGQPGAAPAAAPGQPAPGAIRAATAGMPPGTIVGMPQPSPAAQAQINVAQRQAELPIQIAQRQAEANINVGQRAAEVPIKVGEAEQTARAQAYGDVSKQIITAGSNYQQKLERLDVLENAASEFRPGATADTRAAALHTLVDALQTAGMKPPAWMLKGATGAEVIGKEGGYLAAEMTRALGSREAASVFQAVRGIQPNLSLSTGGYQAVVNSIREGVMRDRDLLNFQDQWLADPAHGHSIKGMIEGFNKAYPVQTYASRVMPYPIKPGTKQTDLVPNTIYRNAAGQLGLWNGHGFVPAPAQ